MTNVPPEADVLQNTLTWPAAAAGHVIQLNKTAVVVAKPFRPEAESPLLQRNSFRPDVSKMFRNKTFFILFNCTYTSFRPPSGPGASAGVAISVPARLPPFCVLCFQDYTIPVMNPQAPIAPLPARQTAGRAPALTKLPSRTNPEPSQFFQNSRFAAQCPKISKFRTSHTIWTFQAPKTTLYLLQPPPCFPPSFKNSVQISK